MNHSFFDSIVNKMITNRSVFGAIFCVENEDRSISWRGAAGDLEADDHYFIASVTKMIISALILHLREKEKVGFLGTIGSLRLSSRYRPLFYRHGEPVKRIWPQCCL